MKYIRSSGVLFILSLFLVTGFAQKQVADKTVPVSFCISKEEMKLANMINEYRTRYGLPPIPVSRSLSFVAVTHVKDLFFNKPDKKPCNVHSWSDKGNWKPFCYPGDETKLNSVWDKPRELTNYKGKGYEMVYWENGKVNIDSIMDLWKSEEYFNSFLVSSGKWTGTTWNALGIGIYENYAVAWFGLEKDVEGPVYVCGTEPPPKPVIVEPKPAVPPVAEKKPTSKKPQPEPKPETKEKPVVPVTPAAPKDSLSITSAVPGIYYIVVKSQLPLKASEKEMNTLVSKGYYQSKILKKDNKLRVSIMEFPLKAQADSALREVKKLYKDAWILIK